MCGKMEKILWKMCGKAEKVLWKMCIKAEKVLWKMWKPLKIRMKSDIMGITIIKKLILIEKG